MSDWPQPDPDDWETRTAMHRAAREEGLRRGRWTETSAAAGRMYNPNMIIEFQGFQSSVARLSSAGWDIQADQNMERRTIQMVFTHNYLSLILISEMREFDFFGEQRYDYARICDIRMKAQHYTPDTRILRTLDFNNLCSVETVPRFEEQEVRTLDDLLLFKPKTDNQVIVKSATVSEMLEEIKKQQAPKQAELREKLRKSRRREIYGVENSSSNFQSDLKVKSHVEIITID